MAASSVQGKTLSHELRASRASARGQALVEAAMVIPLLLVLAFGGIAVGRLVQARMALDAVTREAARTTALSPMPRVGSSGSAEQSSAQAAGEAHGDDVARGYGLNGVVVHVRTEPWQHGDPDFGPGSQVTATAHYDVPLSNLPFMRQILGHASFGLDSKHIERIDPFRSLQP